MNKNTLFQKPIIFCLLGVVTAFTVMMFFVNKTLFWVQLAILFIAIATVLLYSLSANRRVTRLLQSTVHALKAGDHDLVNRYPLPVAVANDKGEAVWYNDLFRDSVLGGHDIYGESMRDWYGNLKFLDPQFVSGREEVILQTKKYTAYAVRAQGQSETRYLFYFVDNTDLKKYYQEYFDTRPAVLFFMIDNYDELVQSASDSEKSQVIGEIELAIERYVLQSGGLVKKYERDKMIAVVEERYIKNMIEKKFEILDRVRTIMAGGRMQATLSIGVGRGGNSFSEAEHLARQALEMCLGRGGDQAAVKTETGYDFFGGLSKGVEKQTKVKARIVASALRELIDAADNVVVMGHNFGDLDAVGAAVGVAMASRQMGKMSYIAVNEQKNLALPLIQMLRERGITDLFYSPEEALSVINKKTLLIVVDTHIKHLVESPEIYAACKTVVVIDHHRKSVDHIDNAVLFYHEPYASSASEMVTELVQYLSERKTIGKNEAESLLAGIMLDTKNFVLKTGVRTFEAAAYLRRLGADTVQARKLFANSMDAYQKKTRLVSSAEVYRRCAVAVYTEGVEGDVRIVAAQAADELLTINDVDASFVLFDDGSRISVSGRSFGDLNVQLVLETLGGGGHLTMAGAQLSDVTLDEAKTQLLAAIDSYYDSQKKG